jgi:hypothetical protein
MEASEFSPAGLLLRPCWRTGRAAIDQASDPERQLWDLQRGNANANQFTPLLDCAPDIGMRSDLASALAG